jgi:uncharacterized cupin superfamily protein
MSHNWAAKSAAEIEKTYNPFLVEGEQQGVISLLEGGLPHVDAGLFRVLPGEFPDRSAVEHVFERDEYLWVVEGRVTIESDGESTVLDPVDIAFFGAGHTGMWTFEAPFAKFSVEITVGGRAE